MEPQNQPNPAPATPPQVVPNPVYSAPATTTAAGTGGGLMSIILGVVAVGVVAGGAWWWMGGGNPSSSSNDLNDGGSYTNPFGSGDNGGNLPNSGTNLGVNGGVTQNGGGSGSWSGAGAQSCSSYFSREINTRDMPASSSMPQGAVGGGTFVPTSRVSSRYAQSIQISPNLQVVSRLDLDEELKQNMEGEIYFFCVRNVDSVVSFYNSYFQGWQYSRKTITNGTGDAKEAWVAAKNDMAVSITIFNPNNLVNEMIAYIGVTYLN